jgi:hypothetical protein
MRRAGSRLPLACCPTSSCRRSDRASVHDHVGVASDFPLAVDFPRIGPHHDLGLYELALFALVLLPVSALMLRRPRREGLYVGFVAIAYAEPRFFLDFFTIGVALLVDARRHASPAAYRPPTAWRVYLRRFVW